MKHKNQYKKAIATHLGVDTSQIQLYWKGRVALYSILKAMGIKPDDEVILQAFTCVVVPNAILYLGASPVYVDINPSTLNTTLSQIESVVTPKTKCIIIQNTFGLSSEVEEIVAFAKSRNILTIEDCTHGFGGEYNGKPNGSYCDAAFYSSQWNKPFSTGIGGFSLINNPELIQRVDELNRDLIAPTLKQRKVLKILIQLRKHLITDSTYWTLIRLYRSLSRYGLVVGSSTDEELTTIQKPASYFMGSSSEQAKVGVKSLKNNTNTLTIRKKNGLAFNHFLRDRNKWNYPDDVLKNHSFLKYPIFVKNREHFLTLAEKSKIRLGDWFDSPIHPVQANFELWKLDTAKYPIAKEKSQHILNLPTDTTDLNKVLDFLHVHIEELL